MPKKPRTGQTKTKQAKEGTSKKGTQKGKKNNTQSPQVHQKQDEAAKGLTPSPNPQESGPTKRPTTQTWGACKKMKVHRTPPEYTINEDDAEMITQMVQDRTFKYF
jgi:hypothetical protein